ncbi:co-chaperone GroES [Entomospira culicis]|uniref:Co-chaperonin GroES n=1 Tax=Entomospira culicis TaxID=2719989 RepID=A0A968GG47_9SPIO|nr:co-chaperone GroES [Entomospira culicis]NIZ19727.1 co-chaperone GroES [Entomospira culicis]NIZ69941.1 co-chaperone GroES [Entomospira culicis]WDI37046.1 co-chaperone GroES [Entomospira culicis]WDI38675.1 co-chaperone GroES [Entomospira culicis]
MNITPLADRVLLKMEVAEKKTASGLFIPDSATQEKTHVAQVVAIGDDHEKIKVKVGDKVIYDKYAANQFKLDGVEYIIVQMKDVIATLNA